VEPIQDDISGPEVQSEAGTGDRSKTDEYGRPLELLAWEPVKLDKLTSTQLSACHELFRRGDISWLLHPEQLKLLTWLEEKKRDIAVICISRQWGKSFMQIAYGMSFCLRHPRSNVLFVAPYKTQLNNYIMPKMNAVFQFMPDDLVPVRRDLSWTFANGSIFRADGVSIGRGARIRGDAAHLVVMDECRDMSDLKDTVESAISPMLTTTNGNIVMISTPPESPLHEFTDHYIRSAIHEGNFYAATYKQNPLLSTKRIRYLIDTLYKGGESNITFRREYMADYSVADPEKRVIREWDEKANDAFFASYAGPPNPVRMYVGMDYGFADPCGVVMGYYDHMEGVLVIEDEHFERRMSTDDIGNKLVEMETRLKDRLPGVSDCIRVMDIDPSLMVDLWQRYRLRFEPAYKVPSVLTMINRLRTHINEGRIRVRKNCVNLRFQMQAGVYNQKGTEFARTERGGHLDLVTALQYLNLNVRWNELKARESYEPPGATTQNRMYSGPFQRPNTFRQGVIQRPV